MLLPGGDLLPTVGIPWWPIVLCVGLGPDHSLSAFVSFVAVLVLLGFRLCW